MIVGMDAIKRRSVENFPHIVGPQENSARVIDIHRPSFTEDEHTGRGKFD